MENFFEKTQKSQCLKYKQPCIMIDAEQITGKDAKSMTTKWNDEYAITTYELAKQGYSGQQIAKMLSITHITFYNWVHSKKILKYAFSKGRKLYKAKEDGKGNGFLEYVNGRLSKPARKIYRKIVRLDKARSGVEAIEELLKDKGKRFRQLIFLHSLVSSNFKIRVALRRANVSHKTFKKWKEEDPEFPDFYEELRFHRGNFFEDALSDLIMMRDPQACRFANETFNADRGYRKQIDMRVDQHSTNEMVVTIEDLNLTFEQQKELLNAVRRKPAENVTVTNTNQKQ